MVLKASGKTTVFEGFLKAYRDDGGDESVPGGAAAEGERADGSVCRVCRF